MMFQSSKNSKICPIAAPLLRLLRQKNYVSTVSNIAEKYVIDYMMLTAAVKTLLTLFELHRFV